MPTPKKAAKKSAAKHGTHEDPPLKDRRRAHEHLGRVEALHKLVDQPVAKEIETLKELAHQEIEAGKPKGAADLLRAAEHLSFGSLHAPKSEEADPKLAEELTREFEGKLAKADEHWSENDDHLDGLNEIFAHAKDRAQKSFDEGAYRQALELARAAEALSHVEMQNDKDGQDTEANDGVTDDESETE